MSHAQTYPQFEPNARFKSRRRKQLILTVLAGQFLLSALFIVQLLRTGKPMFVLGVLGYLIMGVFVFVRYLRFKNEDYPPMVFNGQQLSIPGPPNAMLDLTRPYQATFVIPKTATQFVYELQDGSHQPGDVHLTWAAIRVEQDNRAFAFMVEDYYDPSDVGSPCIKSTAPPVLNATVVCCDIRQLGQLLFSGNQCSPLIPGLPQPSRAPGVVRPIALFADSIRLVVQPDYSFQQLTAGMASLGMAENERGPNVSPGEVSNCRWADAEHTIDYHFDPHTFLRALQVRGPRAEYLRNDLLNMLYLPTIDSFRIPKGLASEDETQVLHAIAAAQFLAQTKNPLVQQALRALVNHPSATIAQAATAALS